MIFHLIYFSSTARFKILRNDSEIVASVFIASQSISIHEEINENYLWFLIRFYIYLRLKQTKWYLKFTNLQHQELYGHGNLDLVCLYRE